LWLSLSFLAVFCISLTYSILQTGENQPFAFFGTHTRAWQLALGALTVFMVRDALRWKNSSKLILGLFSLCGFIAALILLKENGNYLGHTYPSFLALLPALTAAGLILSGVSSTHFLTKFLSLRPLTFIGDISYSLYLWHWPILILGPIIFGVKGLQANLYFILAAFLLSVITYGLVENPIRTAGILNRRPLLSIKVGALALAAAIVPAFLLVNPHPVNNIKLDELSQSPLASSAFQKLSNWGPPQQSSLHSRADSSDGVKVARWVASSKPIESGSGPQLIPLLSVAGSDEPPLKGICHKDFRSTDLNLPPLATCSFGAKNYDHTVFITGDSIANAIMPGVAEWAETNGWRVILMSMSSCTFSEAVGELDDRPYTECSNYGKMVFDKILEIKPNVLLVANAYRSNDVIFANGKKFEDDAALKLAAKGFMRKIKLAQKAGILVAVAASPPETSDPSPISCLAEKRDASRCHFPRDDDFDFMKYIYDNNHQVFYVDTLSTFCATDCFPVVNNYVLFRDKFHFTATYSRDMLSPLFGKFLTETEKIS
jgi:hypothetical protein